MTQPVASLEESLQLSVLEELIHELQELGLSPYEARALLALLRMGSANSAELARVAGIPRTSTYVILEELGGKRLAQRMPGEGPAVWVSPGQQTVLDRLYHSQEEKLKEQKARAKRLGQTLQDALPETPAAALPFFQVLAKAAHVKKIFDELFAGAKQEVLALSRPPYTWYSDDLNPVVLDALGRGVIVRAIYQEAVLDNPQSEAFRSEIAAYVKSGVDARLVDELPAKMVIFDRKAVLLAMEDPKMPDPGYLTNLLIEHPGFAELQAGAFERLWEDARLFHPEKHPTSA